MLSFESRKGAIGSAFAGEADITILACWTALFLQHLAQWAPGANITSFSNECWTLPGNTGDGLAYDLFFPFVATGLSANCPLDTWHTSLQTFTCNNDPITGVLGTLHLKRMRMARTGWKTGNFGGILNYWEYMAAVRAVHGY